MAFGLCKEATKLANTIPMLKVANSKAVRSDHRWQSVRHNMKSGNTIAKEQNEKEQTAITDGSEAQEAIWSRRRKFCQFPAIIHNLKDCSGYMVRPRHHHHHHHSHHGWSLNTSADDQSQVIVIIVSILIWHLQIVIIFRVILVRFEHVSRWSKPSCKQLGWLGQEEGSWKEGSGWKIWHNFFSSVIPFLQISSSSSFHLII